MIVSAVSLTEERAERLGQAFIFGRTFLLAAPPFRRGQEYSALPSPELRILHIKVSV